MLAILLLLIALSIIILTIRANKNNKKFPEPPALKGKLPLIGHLHLMKGPSGLWTFFEKAILNSLDTGAMTIKLAWRKLYVVTDPHYCQIAAKCLLEKDATYKIIKMFWGDGLITCDEVVWRGHRKLLNPAFNPVILEGYMTTFNNQARKLVDNLFKEVGKGPFNQLDYISVSSIESVTYTIMGIDEQKDASVKNEILEVTEKAKTLFMTLYIKIWLQISFIRNMFKIKNEIDDVANQFVRIVEQIIEQKQKCLKISNAEFTHLKFQPFLDVLLNTASAFLTEKEIREEVMTMLVTAYETVSITITIILKLLGCHRDIGDKVYKELCDIFEDSYRDVDNDDLKQMVLLKAVINESLRLFPSVPGIGRLVDKDLDLGKFTLARGNTCVLSFYTLHRHPAWGPDADQFRPQRWLDQTTPDLSLYYAPFGMGKRNCIGQVYAMKIMMVTLAHILRRYKVSADDNEMVFNYAVVLNPLSNHHITITERNTKT